ncbi:Two component transcriptional regulator, LuxR family (fragment) [Nitrospira japonica]|uniref:Two component transcriptional regulator, LuxR family n=1 Tax=Nitrospira japonica TaxID=1325564 RepID=A0A1W1I0Q1_9BACT
MVDGRCRPIRLVVAEDNAMMRMVIRRMLADQTDLRVVGEAVDGSEATALTEDLLPDVVVMDINMPRMNGIEAARYIKLHFPHIAILGLSANADEYRDTMLELGAKAVIQKETMYELNGAIRAAVQEIKHSHGTTLTNEPRPGGEPPGAT